MDREKRQAIQILESFIVDPRQGLPEEVFLFISRLTPMVNVDLLIQDERKRTLLTWRDDGFYPPGWHIPGGIIRFKETAANRIQAVARQELGVEVEFDSTPLAVNEVIHPIRDIRGHSISLLFRCKLVLSLDEGRRYQTGNPQPDAWMWHGIFPENMIPVHAMYRRFIEFPPEDQPVLTKIGAGSSD